MHFTSISLNFTLFHVAGAWYRHLVGQVWAHGPGVALVTPNVDTNRNPVLACVAVGPGEGDLLGEPTVRLGDPLVRLTDLEPQLQSQWHTLLTFARDPKALHDALKLQWGLWEKYGREKDLNSPIN